MNRKAGEEMSRMQMIILIAIAMLVIFGLILLFTRFLGGSGEVTIEDIMKLFQHSQGGGLAPS